ncbi:hypothetical protein BDP27DRAFT_1323081 [Rhodocollybia butyracea]|uniref:Uncharacterized protein n=1 Tax=Rhodocollybia butyracea TaxID=206335 RepID=A0A9P5U9C7_9AGAR|nr:hypothetical protein BDP27DRAFT_1323081 [Rhodocollybia butyracea]
MAHLHVVACVLAFLWISSDWLGLVVGEVVPFIEPGFFFSYGSIPVTEQCETIRLVWGRQSAIGQNPVAPYSMQILTSSFIFPFIVDVGVGGDAGDGNLFFDFTVPFAPGTQYQICMYDSNGIPGGCQFIFTMIQNSTVTNPTCQNMTFPAQVLDIKGTVDGGALSQTGFINQCDDVSIKPLNGTPPFTLTISPPNHPPYNITSNSMDPIVWTVSLSRAMPFFMSLVSSEGLLWANGPMGVGSSNIDICLAPDALLATKAHAIAAGAGVGGLFGGFLLVGVAFLVRRYLPRGKRDSIITPWIEQMDGPIHKLSTNPTVRSTTQTSDVSTLYPGQSASQLFIRHQDGGRILSTFEVQETMGGVVELPPTYSHGAGRAEGSNSWPRPLLEKPLPRVGL